LIIMKEETDLRFEKGIVTKNKILSSALDIICDEGIKGLSASKIAKLSGISKSNVFHHFNSVETIPFVLLKNIGGTLTDNIKSRIFKDFSSFLEYLGEMTFTLDSSYIRFFKAFFSFYQTAMFDEQYKEAVELCSQSFKNQIIVEIKKHYDNREDSEEIATLINSTLDGMGIHYLISDNREKSIYTWSCFSGMIMSTLEM